MATCIVALLVGTEVLGRLLRLPTEYTRKGTHLASGAVVLSFPWLLHHTVTVILLAITFFFVLYLGRLTGLLGSIHDVERRTSGAYYYPFAVLGVWVLSRGDPVLYCVPLAIMAVADTGAALVGQRTGEVLYRVLDGHRTLEGSLAFFGISFAIVLVGAALSGRFAWPDALLLTVVVAGLTTAAEAISVRGADNLAVPYAAWLGLDQAGRLGLEALGEWILGMSLGLGVLFITLRLARLSTAGAVTLFLVVTLSWALGGLAWLLPLLCLYALYLVGRPPGMTTDLDVLFPSAVGPMLVVLLLAHTGNPALYAAFLAAVAANGAMAGAMAADVRGWSWPLPCLVGTAAPSLGAVAAGSQVPLLLPLAAGAVGLALFTLLDRTPLVGRRMVASLTTALGAWWVAL